jgi:NADPH:quinone reductase-like Zn-dependent oxidoreductase
MRVFQVEEAWSMDHVRLTTRPDPSVGRGQVRLKMRASALNYRDLIIPTRGYGSKQQTLPLILLGDGVGVVESIGESVTRVAVGDRVCPLFAPDWIGGEPDEHRLWRTLGCESDGTMAEFMVVPEDAVSRVPEHLSDVEAATLPCAGVTAWRALVTEGGVKAGDKVLVQGTGGVSMFAMQFANAHGAYVNYRTKPEWGRHARELAAGGVDHVIEVGGQQTLPQSLRAVRAGGTISMIGVLSGANMDVRLGPIVTRHIRLQGITLGSRDDFEAMTRAMALHGLRPVIDRVFDFEALPEAFDHLASGKQFGKICIRH